MNIIIRKQIFCFGRGLCRNLSTQNKLKANKLIDPVEDIKFNYKSINSVQKIQQIAKEAYLSATDYKNGNHYSKLTDLTSFHAGAKIHHKMMQDQIGRRILKQKPRITDDVYMSCSSLPEGTLGKQYYKFMSQLNFLPSERPLVSYIPDLQIAYTLQRYKQIHDFLHVLLANHISVNEELLIKWFEMRQLEVPSATLASMISPFMMGPTQFVANLGHLNKIIKIADKTKFILNVYYEQLLDKNIEQVKKQLGYV